MLKLEKSDELSKLLKLMIEMYNSIEKEDLEAFKDIIKNKKTSYLTQLLSDKTTFKESYMVECFHKPLINNFQSTGIRVTEVLARFRIHIAV
jgi:hypothetical protein